MDTHIHHSAAMTCQTLFKFIKEKLKTEKDTVIEKSGKKLGETMEALGINENTINIDMLDV